MSSWELERRWEIVRYLVYYLIEDLVAPELIPGKDVVDFSAGLGDLSVYLFSHHPQSLIATAPDDSTRPQLLTDLKEITFLSNVPANQIATKLAPATCDLFIARMVFQFPTVEGDSIDVDGILQQIHQVLRPGGRLIVASHEYTELDRQVQATWQMPVNELFEELLSTVDEGRREHLAGLIELIQTIGIPPREGIHGQTGFGLKALMTIDSFVRAGFTIEKAEEIEDFTFPIGISSEIEWRTAYYEDLAEKVFAIKRKHILSDAFVDKYSKPNVLRTILKEINALHPFVTIPVFAIQAIKE